MRCHLTPVRMAIIKRKQRTNIGKDVEERDALLMGKLVQPLWKTV